MFRISQRFAACFTALVAALGVFAALPFAATQSVVASSFVKARASTLEGAAREALQTVPSLARALTPGKGAATSGHIRLTESLAEAPAILAQFPARPFAIPGHGPQLRGTLVAQTERLDIYVGIDTFSEADIASLSWKLEQILRDNEVWFGTRLSHRVSIGFYRPSASEVRGARGMAYTDQARAEVYFAAGEDMTHAFTVAAHELGHHLEEARYGTAVQKRADTMLHEGLATWITGQRWLTMCGATSWRERAQQLRAQGIPLRLLSAEQSGANNAYELWASFVFYIAHQYGWEKFDALYASSTGRAPGSADYKRITGRTLDELAADWRAWVG